MRVMAHALRVAELTRTARWIGDSRGLLIVGKSGGRHWEPASLELDRLEAVLELDAARFEL